MTKAELKAEALREPKAGDVWNSKRITRMIYDVRCSWLRYFATDCGESQPMMKASFRRWARTAELVRRGK